MLKRDEWLAKMRPLRDQGMTYEEIAEEIGCGVSLARNYLTDPDGEKARVRKARYNQTRRGEVTFPVERVIPIVRSWTGTMTELERQTGIDARQIYAILNGERKWVTLGVVDRLVCGMGRPEAFHNELADIYEAA